MRLFDYVLAGAIIVGFGVYAIASDESRKPATIPKKTGVLCSQDVSIRGAEERMNSKLGSGSETTLTLANQFGKVSEGRITSLSVNYVPDKQSPSGFLYIICAGIAGS